VILIGYWAFFALHPLPGLVVDRVGAEIPADWPCDFTGFAAHWNLNTNAAWAFDRWFLNLFPFGDHFKGNPDGYSTLSFIPTLGTMILGLIAGGWMRGDFTPKQRIQRLLIAGGLGLVAGLALHALGVCPLVKRIWTPTWTLFSGGWSFLFLAGFYAVVDVWGFRKCAFPLVVIGMNSIAAYCMAHWMEGFVNHSIRVCFGSEWPKIFGEAFVPMLSGAGILLGFWLILYWMYRRKIFLRV